MGLSPLHPDPSLPQSSLLGHKEARNIFFKIMLEEQVVSLFNKGGLSNALCQLIELQLF